MLDLEYCNVCDSLFCPGCWKRNLQHKRGALAFGSIPHEATDVRAARIIKPILEERRDLENQNHEHVKDQNTTWVGISWEDVEFPVFREFGRYAAIMADNRASVAGCDTKLQQDQRNPSLVAIVGETGKTMSTTVCTGLCLASHTNFNIHSRIGAGKSTVIKLIIDLLTFEESSHATPVIGPTGSDIPTSGDIHLYIDPQSSCSQRPILYADCEGLDGGERPPLAARIHRNEDAKGNDRGAKAAQPHLPISERELTWATTRAKRTRAFAVSQMYPRLLYTFSDTIVFVLKNSKYDPITRRFREAYRYSRKIEKTFEKLVEWAAAALEKSSNQPALPHAVVVLNASENDIDEALWDCDKATKKILASLSDTVFHNAVFHKHANFWRDRDRKIRTLNQLLHAYYASIKIIHVPTKGRPNLIQEQIIKLYSAITQACDLSRKRKAEGRMLLDADELQSYLQYAFDHFARDLNTPFDFVQASFVNSPIPLNFGGNILKLAIIIMDTWKNEVNGYLIFKELSYMVVSCIMLDSARSKVHGKSLQMEHYM